MAEHALYIGLMSGTSLDGVDGVLCRFDTAASVQVLAHQSIAFDAPLRAELLALNSPSAAFEHGGELHRAALAGNEIARRYATVVARLLANGGMSPRDVRAIGAHGQTVRHRPGEFDGTGYTIQLNAPALLAELAGIDVVADLRSRDVAAGGQGAPLVPAFHQAVLGHADATVAVLNIGGISNLTVLRSDAPTLGFDCGPGNALMDAWCARHTGQPYDAGGAWAASGRTVDALLRAALGDPYFSRTPPKSTGRDLFNEPWLNRLLAAQAGADPADVQATLCELTAACCANDVTRYAPQARELVVCGGGALNTELMRRLAAALPAVQVMSSGERGLPPQQVEACAFAWLARAHVMRLPGTLAGATGAAGPRVLGALYPA
jgi:anhydro-N-acetylmuramic acid kinase